MENMQPQAPQQTMLTKKQNMIQMLKFVLFSMSAGVIQIVSFTLLNELARFNYWPAYLIALTMSVIYNFTVNRRFTFKSAKSVPLAMMQVIGYYLVFTPLSTWWGEALTRIGWNEYVVLLGTMVINLITEFSFCRFVVYRKDMFTSEAGKHEMEESAK
ncbi:MAG: GtrA family protein [Clostridia bacterium]